MQPRRASSCACHSLVRFVLSRGFVDGADQKPATPCKRFFSSATSYTVLHPELQTSSREDTICRLRQLGFTDGPSLAVISSMPNLPPDLPQKVQIFLSEGFPLSALKRMQTLPRFFSYLCGAPLSKVAGMIELVGPRVVRSAPGILQLRVENVKQKLQLYKDLGLDCTYLGGSILQLTSKLETLKRHLTEFQELGFPEKVMATVVKRHPSILTTDVQKYVKPAMALIEKYTGLQGEAMHRFIMFDPEVISHSTSVLQHKFEFFKGLGLDLKSKTARYAFFQLYRCKTDTLFEKISWLIACGLPWEVVLYLISSRPRAIACRQETLAEKLSYLLHDLNLDVKEVAECPMALSLSLEKCIKPRFAVVSKLRDKGLLKKNPRLSLILYPSNATFKRMYIDKLNAEAS